MKSNPFLVGLFRHLQERDQKMHSVNKGIHFIETENKNFPHLQSLSSSFLWVEVLKASHQNEKLNAKEKVSFMLYILCNKTCGQWFERKIETCWKAWVITTLGKGIPQFTEGLSSQRLPYSLRYLEFNYWDYCLIVSMG